MLGPRSGTVDPRREARADDASAASDLGERCVHHEASAPGVLKPDATLVGTTAGGERTAVMLEYDRTRRASKQLTRLRRYDHFLTAGWRESRYAVLDVEPALLVVCSDERQLPTFVRAADDELTAWIGRPQADRRNGEHIGREQVGFTTRERLLAGDSRLLQVPFLPPPIRRGRSTGDLAAVLRETSLSLDVLFVAGGPPSAASESASENSGDSDRSLGAVSLAPRQIARHHWVEEGGHRCSAPVTPFLDLPTSCGCGVGMAGLAGSEGHSEGERLVFGAGGGGRAGLGRCGSGS
jgi:hypothetical protein